MKAKTLNCLFLSCLCFGALADTVKLQALVLDDVSGEPIRDAEVTFSFTEDVGIRIWNESNKHHTKVARTDVNGVCRMSGESNCGRAGCYVKTPPTGYLHPARGFLYKHKGKSIFGVWQPDNLVATIRLQRVEHPIPLSVKRVRLADFEKGIFKEKGPNGILQFDLMKGDWLPPHGNGVRADLTIDSLKTITGSVRDFNFQTRKWDDVSFYDFRQKISVPSNDCLTAVNVDPFAGIKIRFGSDLGHGTDIVRQMGLRKRIDKRNKWHYNRYEDYDEGRCYTFRIRSRHDENGKLVEAYYGKIYGDFEFQYNEDLGITEVCFTYYLNPVSLDKNLEWDMKTNLCPDPGWLNDNLP